MMRTIDSLGARAVTAQTRRLARGDARVPWGWLAALAAAIVLHGLVAGGLVGGVGAPHGEAREPPTAVVATRTIAALPMDEAGVLRLEPVAAVETPAAPVAPREMPAPRAGSSRALSAPAARVTRNAVADGFVASGAASAPRPEVGPASPSAPTAEAGEGIRVATAAVAAEPVALLAAAAPAASAAADGIDSPASALPPILAAGEAPPPVYRVQLPPAALWRYEVRRGFFRGTGEIRWQPSADGAAYRLELEARAAGILLLRQSSVGIVDGHGVAPERFVDQRARRAAIAATFDRAATAVTFSAVTRTLPLYAGTQDRLSWLVQLAAIARAEPGRLAAGGRVEMVVVGARGDASVWSFRSEGVESVDTVAGPVRAVKLSRAPRGAWDSSAEVWLDPERGHVPVHATLKNAQGQVEYDLLLERIDPLP